MLCVCIHVHLCVQYESCFMCRGFYGLNYDQPLCSTCHMFLYPSNINWLEEAACAEVSFTTFVSRYYSIFFDDYILSQL